MTEHLQRTIENLIHKAVDSSSATLTAFPEKKKSNGGLKTGLEVVSNIRSLDAIPAAAVSRQRRIQDDDDDDNDDDIPVFRGAISALLPMPQSKLPQVSASNDDDEIVLLRMTQSTQQATVNSSAAVLLTASLDSSANICSSASKSIQSNDDKTHESSGDDDAPMVHPPESHRVIQESTLSPAILAAAAQTSLVTAAVVRPKLKGLGSLVRRWCSCFNDTSHLFVCLHLATCIR